MKLAVENAAFVHIEFDCPCCGKRAFVIYRASGNLAKSTVFHREEEVQSA